MFSEISEFGSLWVVALTLEDVDVEVAMIVSTSNTVVSSLLGGVLETGIPVSVLMLEDEATEVAICCPSSEVLELGLSVVAAAKISLLREFICVADAEGVSVRVVATKKKIRRTRA